MNLYIVNDDVYVLKSILSGQFMMGATSDFKVKIWRVDNH